MESSNKLLISGFKFGIELECNIEAWKMAEKMTFEPGWRCHDEHCGAEIVSPVLHGYGGLLSLRRQLRHLWKWRKKITFADCGLHVHVDIQDFNLGQLKRLLTIASRFDQTIFCMLDGCRWNNNYTRRCNYDEKKIRTAKGLSSLQNLQRNDRYSGLNLHAFSKHGTAEFRYAMGSADWQKIYSLTVLYLKMVAAARSDMEIPKSNPVSEFGAKATGIKNAKENLKILQKNRDILFDFLLIRGAARKTLVAMFDANVFDTTNRNNKSSAQLTESRDKIKFSLKRD